MKNNDSVGNILNKTDIIVNSYYNQNIVDNFLNFFLVKKILANDFFKKLNNWYVNNILIINKILGILGIVGGILLILSTLQYLFYLKNILYGLFYLIIYAVLSFLSFISGIGFLLNKKWTPFIALIYCGYSISTVIFIEILNTIFLPFYRFYGVSIFSIFIGLSISLIISIILCSLILGNKEKFDK